jgi:acetyl esterase
MPLDPAIAALLSEIEKSGPPINQLPVSEARLVIDNIAPLGGHGGDVASQHEVTVAGLPAVVYTPHGEAPFPVLVWLHGGGWVIGGPQHYHATCRDLAAGAGCIVVSVDYRLAPDHKAPAAVDDSVGAVGWVLEHAAELGGDPDRVAVGGDSAGGNLSALVAQHFGRRLAAQLLVYPATDLTMATSPSLDENAEGYFLTKDSMLWFGDHYLDGCGIERDDPRVSPAFASDDVLAATPPALVITAEFDPLRDEGEAYGARLQALGVPAKVRRFDGMIHAFYVMRVVTPAAAEAIDESTAFLRDAFSA